MAGAGYKLFNTGDVLTAAQVNTYLQEQTVMVFANSTARTTALSGVLAEGMMSYLQDTNAVEVYNGTSWVNVGNAGDITEVQAGVGISIASGTGPIPVITNSSTDLITTAGDILYGTAADTMTRLGIGTAGQVLTVNSGATAPQWATPTSGGMTLLATTTLSSTTTTVSSISQSYKHLLVIFRAVHSNSGSFAVRTNGITTGNYYCNTDEVGNGLAFASVWQSGATEFPYTENIPSDTNNTGYMWIYDYSNAAVVFKYTESKFFSDGGDDILGFQGVNRGTGSSGIDSITYFSPSGATIAGTALLYGVS